MRYTSLIATISHNNSNHRTSKHASTSWRSDGPPSCLGGSSHGWVLVETHSTPVPISVERLWVAHQHHNNEPKKMKHNDNNMGATSAVEQGGKYSHTKHRTLYTRNVVGSSNVHIFHQFLPHGSHILLLSSLFDVIHIFLRRTILCFPSTTSTLYLVLFPIQALKKLPQLVFPTTIQLTNDRTNLHAQSRQS